MGYTLTKIGKEYNYDLKEFFCDSVEDIASLPTSSTLGSDRCLAGSKAILANGEEYFLNSSDTWVKKTSSYGGASSIEIDNTLTQEGQAADAKAVGDALKNKVDSSALASYLQTSTAESTYAKKSDLASKVDSSALSGYLQTSTAEETYAKKTEIPSKGTAVADAEDGDVKDKLNALLVSLRTAGVIATE